MVYISVYDQIRIVRDHYDLSTFAGTPKEMHKFRINGPRVKIFFRLVNHQRNDIIAVYGKVKKE